MRTKNKDRRILISHQNECDIFENEYDYYTKNNQYPIRLYDKDIISIYHNINIQVLVTRKCNLNCKFCIEKHEHIGENESDKIYDSLEYLLQRYNENNIVPRVTFTGGEPTVCYEKVNNLIFITKQYNCVTNLNTNGYNLEEISQGDLNYINISSQNCSDILRSNENYHGYTIQKVITDATTFDGLINFMNYYINLGASGFSFRGITTEYNTENKSYIFFNMLNQFIKDRNITFVEQKIGDHFIYEMFNYKGKFIRLTYSNFDYLYKKEKEEVKNNENYSRANVILPNGDVYFGWNYDLKPLKIGE